MNRFKKTLRTIILALLTLGLSGCMNQSQDHSTSQIKSDRDTRKKDPDLCKNGVGGLPISTGDAIICTLEVEQTDLSDQTHGFIKSARFFGDLKLSTAPAQGDGIPKELAIKIEKQTVTGELITSNDSVEPVTIELAPEVHFVGQDFCSIKATKILVNLTKFDSALGKFVGNLAMNYLNKNDAFLKDTLNQLNEALAVYTKENCKASVADQPTPVPFKDPNNLLAKLEAKKNRYLNLSKSHLDEKGWIKDTHCDGLLFSALYGYAGGDPEIHLAEDKNKPGKFYRHWQQDCYANHLKDLGNSSKSSISRDMILGLILWAHKYEKIEIIENLIQYGKQRTLQGFPLVWIVGEGQFGRVELRPSLIQTLYDIRKKLKGTPSPYENVDFQAWDNNCRGYPCHLSLVTALLLHDIKGALPASVLRHVKIVADRNPRNALYNGIYAKIAQDGTYRMKAIKALFDQKLFPDDRLPNSNDRCSEYLFQREEVKNGEPSKSWAPCEEKDHTYSGVDFLFAAEVVLEN